MKKSELNAKIAELQSQVAKLQFAETREKDALNTIEYLQKRVDYFQYPTPELAMHTLIATFQRDRWSGFTAVSERLLKATHAANARDEKFTSNDARRMTLASPEFQEWIIKNYVGGDK